VPALKLTPEAERYASVVRAQASRLRSFLAPEVDLEELVDWGNEGLMIALQDFKKRQGTTFQTFAYYCIRGAILKGLGSAGSYSSDRHVQYLFLNKSNQLLQWYSSSSEAFVKRSRQAEVDELNQLCQALAIMFLLCLAASTRFEIKQASAEYGFISLLNEKDESFIQSYYFEDASIQECAQHRKISVSIAQRTHFKILTTLTESLQHSGNRNPS
jgi:RNA polymerase sigma factor for flagellar operon FliA